MLLRDVSAARRAPFEPPAEKPKRSAEGLPMPPELRRRYPGQLILELARDRLGLFGRMAQLGDITCARIGRECVVLLNHPDDVKNVLVTNQRNFTKGIGLERTKTLLGNGLLTSEGDFHLRQRRLMQSAFHRERIAEYADSMCASAVHVQDRWVDGETLDIHAEMMRLTLVIAGKTLFGADVDHEASDVAEAMELSLKMFNHTLILGTVMEHVPLPWIRRWRRARIRLEEIIFQMMQERRASGVDRGDLLSMLIAAHDDEGDGTGMTDRQLRDEFVTILMAGHETTAVALSWAWYLLSEHPDVEAKLHAELSVVLGGRTPTLSDLPSLQFTRMVFAESMRLYPPAWIIERRAIEGFEVGGYGIPRGALVLVSPYLVQHDPRWWGEPGTFYPERFPSDVSATRPKFAYFPFGAGTRMCIGEQFAWMEGTLALATIAQRWRLRHDPTHRVAMQPLVTLRPKYGMRMSVFKRM